ncbi:uncharacterized protein METZ01_LOCUS196653, partial [marine metagenome]
VRVRVIEIFAVDMIILEGTGICIKKEKSIISLIINVHLD